MMKKSIILSALALLCIQCISVKQKVKSTPNASTQETAAKENTAKPKLVVGLVVDQMRYDYITRFKSKYGNDGFMRMIREGFNCKNNHFIWHRDIWKIPFHEEHDKWNTSLHIVFDQCPCI